MDKNKEVKTALITGASGGIGYELSRLFAQDGYNLVLVARSMDKLNAIAGELHEAHGVSVKIIPADLAKCGAAEKVVDDIRRNGIAIDVLVNNAGFGARGFFADGALIPDQDMMHLNMFSLVTLTKLVLRDMKNRGEGRIMNVASTAAFQPGPLMAVYYASKAFVYSFSEALAMELEGSGITVTTFCPGPTRTNFAKTAGAEETFVFRRINTQSAAAVAETGYRALMAGKRLVIVGILNKILVQAVRILPRKWVMKIVIKMQQ